MFYVIYEFHFNNRHSINFGLMFDTRGKTKNPPSQSGKGYCSVWTHFVKKFNEQSTKNENVFIEILLLQRPNIGIANAIQWKIDFEIRHDLFVLRRDRSLWLFEWQRPPHLPMNSPHSNERCCELIRLQNYQLFMPFFALKINFCAK